MNRTLNRAVTPHCLCAVLTRGLMCGSVSGKTTLRRCAPARHAEHRPPLAALARWAGRGSRRAGRPPCPAFLAFQSGAKLPPSSAAARARAAPAQKRGQPLQGSPLNEAHPADYLGEAEIILVPYLAARSMGLNGVPALSLGAGGFAPHAITGRLGAPFLPCLRSAAASLRQCPNYLMAPPKARPLNGAAIGG